ncbi:MAG TPA: hypothetical protein GX513_12600 [Firmicutes bacterium]|nr:hypothetical protein [Bacillota bacterium]
MHTDVGSDLYAFSVMTLAGVTLGLSFDVHRSVRRLLRAKKARSFFLDFLYAVWAGGWVGVCLLVANWAEMRGYMAVALLLGLWVYHFLGSPLVRSGLWQAERGLDRIRLWWRGRKTPPTNE